MAHNPTTEGEVIATVSLKDTVTVDDLVAEMRDLAHEAALAEQAKS